MDTILAMPNGETLEVNFYDVDFREKYGNLIKKYVADINNIPMPKEGESDIPAMRAQADTSRAFFDEVFGEGTSDRIFGTGVKDLYLIFNTLQKITDMKLNQDEVYANMGRSAKDVITKRLKK